MGLIITKAIAALACAIAAIGTVFVLGMRARSVLVINAVRRMTHVTNRFAMKTAGTGNAYASAVIHDQGRNSGRNYKTPVRAVATADGFAIALPYGASSDWVKNVLAGPRATIDYQSSSFPVGRPRIVPLATAASDFSRRDQRMHRLFGVKECLLLTHVERDEGAFRH